MLLLLLLPLQMLAQSGNISVKGTIFDENHDPVPFASVVLKGTTSGVAAGADGKYSISVPRNGVLIFSSIGYLNQEIPVNGRATIDVILVPDSEALEEVMVVAYGTATKSSFTGSAGTVSGEKLQLIPNVSPLNTLNATVPGIRLTSASGQPGSGNTITIRGIGSINSENTPIVVVDGIIYSGVRSYIPSGDIESITVLKDAASTALYGSRAANGVILITTKQGKSEKPTINFKFSTGWVTREFKDYETMGIKDYMETYWRLYYNNQILNGVSPDDAARIASSTVATSLNFTEEYNPWSCGITEVVDINGKYNSSATFKWLDDTDWRSGIEQVGILQDYSVNASGRHGKSSYFASLGYSDTEGYIVGSGFERYTARANVSTNAAEWLKIGVNLATALSKAYGIQSTSQGTTGNVFLIARRMPPVYGVHLHDKTGALILDEHGNPIYDFGEGYVTASGETIPGRVIYSGVNAPRQLRARFNQRDRAMLDVKPYIEISFLKDFKFTANAALYNSNYISHSATIFYPEKATNTPATSKEISNTRKWTFNQLLTWGHNFGKHHVDALLGHESNNYTYFLNASASMRYQIIIGDNYEFDNYIEVSAQPSSYNSVYNTEGYFSRVNYDYDGKYFFSGSFRRDGSSKFARNSRWGNFWSVGGAWVLDREQFIQGIDWINGLKLRASVGTVGSDDLGSYFPWMALYVINQNVDEPGYTQSMTSSGNPDLQWEINTNWGAAIEFSLFNRRLTGSLEYFDRRTTNLLMEVALPPSTGLTSHKENAGGLYNKGVEFQLGYDIIKTRDIRWNVGLNGTYLKNCITSLPVEPYLRNASYNKVEEGHSVYEWWLYQWAGVDPQTGLSIYEIADEYIGDTSEDIVNVNGINYTTNMAKAREDYSGSSIPDLFGGINTSLSWKGFTLSLDLYYQLGGWTYDRAYERVMFGALATTNLANLSSDLVDNMWRQPGDVTNVPILTTNSTYATNVYAQRSTRWLTTTNMLEINSLNLAYSLPKKWCERLKLSKIQVYLAGDHLYVFNARRGLNSNYSLSNYDSGGDRYSPSRTISLGINITL
jgi:TonB-linked SusC/RagA family outer membrane protein